MKIGLLGGSFNPPHQGHLHIANLAIKKLGLNQVWMVPTAYNPLKEKKVYEPYSQRLLICQNLVKNHPKIKVKDFEKDSVYTFDLVKKLRAQYPNIKFYWIMGADSLYKFYLWKNVKSLIKLIDIAVFSRGDDLKKARFYLGRMGVLAAGATCRAPTIEGFDTTCRDGFETRPYDQPKLKLFHTKNYDISSTAIRNDRR